MARARATSPASIEYFEAKVDPTSSLPVDERRRRAAHARTAYFKSLALKSAQKRRGNAA